MKRSPLSRGTSQLRTNKQLVSRKTIKKKTTQQSKIDKSYHDSKVDHYDENELCTGCQKSNNSTPSHLIPRSKRKDLIDDINNLKPHCLDCHDKHESVNCGELLDFEANFIYIYTLDQTYFHSRMAKILKYGSDLSRSKARDLIDVITGKR